MSTPDDRPLGLGLNDPAGPSVSVGDLGGGELAGVPVVDGVKTRKVLVCGGRDFGDHALVNRTLDEEHMRHRFGRLIHGGATGADSIADLWAFRRGVETDVFTPDWGREGKAAGPLRNQRMLAIGKPDLVIAFPGGKGTRNMIDQAHRAGVRVIEVGKGNPDSTEAASAYQKHNMNQGFTS